MGAVEVEFWGGSDTAIPHPSVVVVAVVVAVIGGKDCQARLWSLAK